MTTRYPFLLLALFLFLSGCLSSRLTVSSDVMHLENSVRAPKDPALVETYLDAPSASYKVIAVVRLTAGMTASLDDMRGRMIEEAAKVGGDAVILDDPQRVSVGGLVGSSAYTSLTNTIMSGRVIVFTSPPQGG